MITAEDEEVLRVLDLVREEQANSFQRLLASVDVITQEKVVGLGREPAVLEEAEQVVVLTMDVTYACQRYLASRKTLTANLDGGFEFQQDWLRNEDLSSLGT